MANPLVNRRDITEERNRQANGEAADTHAAHWPHDTHGELAVIAAAIAHQSSLLERMLRQDRAEITQLCVTSRDVAESVLRDFPAPGAKRLIVRRTGTGGTFALAANTPVVIVHSNEARLGGTIVNTGTASVTLCLCALGYVQQAETQGFPQIVLAPGQSWDFRLGILLWGGEVVAVSTAPASLSLAEV